MRKTGGVLLLLAALAGGGTAVQQTYQPFDFGGFGRLGAGLGKLGSQGKGGGGGGGPPPSCSNSLDFSDACNSQYIGLL